MPPPSWLWELGNNYCEGVPPGTTQHVLSPGLLHPGPIFRALSLEGELTVRPVVSGEGCAPCPLETGIHINFPLWAEEPARQDNPQRSKLPEVAACCRREVHQALPARLCPVAFCVPLGQWVQRPVSEIKLF